MSRTLSALIVEDEWPARNYLVELLRETGLFDPIRAVATARAAHAIVAEGALEFEVAFVDIRLVDTPRDTSGLDFARALSQMPQPPLIVLATAQADHALDGFDLGAVDYLLKPLSLSRVQQCAQRLQARARPRHTPLPPQRLVARAKQDLVFLSLEGLLAFEARDRLTYVHHEDGVYDVDLSLNALSAALVERVLRVHRNWLVSPQHVQEMGREDGATFLRLGADLRVPVSRDRAAQIRQHLLSSAIGLRHSGS